MLRLPHDYVHAHFELGYATTVAAPQGRTVDATHALIDHRTTRESLYVAATRARQNTHLYVVTEHHLGLDAEHPPAPETDAHDLLSRAIATDAPEQAATEIRGRARVATRRPVASATRANGAGVVTHRGFTV